MIFSEREQIVENKFSDDSEPLLLVDQIHWLFPHVQIAGCSRRVSLCDVLTPGLMQQQHAG